MERGYLQQRAELSHFDDSAIQERRRQEKAAAEQAAAMRNSSAGNGSSSSSSAGLAVPGNDGVVYDPTHHAADYAGLVNRDALEKTHYQGATQQHMAPSEFGYIAPAQDASTFDHQAGAGRKHYEGDVRFQSREIVPGTAPMFADPSFYVSGGQDSRFESTAMAAANQAPTDPRSFADNGQHGFASGKKHLVPAFEAMDQHRHARGVGGGAANYPGGGMGVVGQPFSDVTNNGRGSSYTGRKGLDAYAQEAPVERGDLVNYRATAFKAGAPSLLSGIGSAVVTAGGGGAKGDRSFSLSGFPDRPRQRETVEAARSREKGTHLLDGRAGGQMPGYTGRGSMR